MLRVCTSSSSLFLSQETFQKSTSTRTQHNILTAACRLYGGLDHYILTVRPLEAISGRVRVAGVVSRFRALESCNITASISYKITYSTLLSGSLWTALDSMLQDPTAFCKC